MKNVFAPVKRESTRHKVSSAIREAILQGRLKTGQRLTEVPLSRQFGVSRAVIREALQQLSLEGLLEQSPYQGARVIHLSPEEVEEIIRLRTMLETEAVRQAKAKITDEIAQELRTLGEEMKASVEDPSRYTSLDLAFHERLWELSGNKTLRKMLHQLVVPFFAMGTILRHSRMLQSPERAQSLRQGDHTPLINALCSGTAEDAVLEMQKHLDGTWRSTRSYLEQFYSATEAESND